MGLRILHIHPPSLHSRCPSFLQIFRLRNYILRIKGWKLCLVPSLIGFSLLEELVSKLDSYGGVSVMAQKNLDFGSGE